MLSHLCSPSFPFLLQLSLRPRVSRCHPSCCVIEMGGRPTLQTHSVRLVLSTWGVRGPALRKHIQICVGVTDENLKLREVRSPAQGCTASFHTSCLSPV